MVRTGMQNEIYPDCPIRKILARICDKWSLLVLYVLSRESLLRFNALQKRTNGKLYSISVAALA